MSLIDAKNFIKTKHYFGQRGKPDEPSVKYMDFLYIAQKKSIPGILKIGITGGDRQLGKTQDFLWSWELIKPKLIEDQIKEQLKLFRSSWIKDTKRGTSQNNKPLPLYGGSNSDYDGSPYEFTTEVFNKEIDIYLLIHLVRLNILAVYANVGLLENTKSFSELFSLLDVTPFEEIKVFNVNAISKNTVFSGKESEVNLGNSIIIERKIENGVYYLFYDNTNYKWKKSNLDDENMKEKIIEFMINQEVIYTENMYGPFKIVDYDDGWLLMHKKEEIQISGVPEDKIDIRIASKRIVLELEYEKLGQDMEILDQYTRRDLKNSELTMSLTFIDIVKQENKKYLKLQSKNNEMYLVDYDKLELLSEETRRQFDRMMSSTLTDSNVSSFSNVSSISSIQGIFDNTNSNFTEDFNLDDSLQSNLSLNDLSDSDIPDDLVGKFITVKWKKTDGSQIFYKGYVAEYIGEESDPNKKDLYFVYYRYDKNTPPYIKIKHLLKPDTFSNYWNIITNPDDSIINYNFGVSV